MKKYQIIFPAVCISAISFSDDATAQNAEKKLPNVLFIMADDLGWRDVGFNGSKFYETPYLDALASKGMIFTNAYAANPLCSPTRASIMTGLYPARIGITAAACAHPEEILVKGLKKKSPPFNKCIEAESLTRLKTEYYTLAEAFRDAGYKTAHFGKWHLGPDPYNPTNQGFDIDIPHWHGPGPAKSYFAPWSFTRSIDSGKPGEHIEDRMATEAIKFLKENIDHPFYLQYWSFSVHAPHGGKDYLVEKYAKKVDPNSPQRNPVNGAMVETLDENIGRLLRAIEEIGASENTIIIFYSDNGGINVPSAQCYPDIPVTSNAPLRGGKATIYEGGTREPCIVYWPGITKAGSVSEEIISSIDWYPSLLEMTGIPLPQNQKFDGISIVPALKGKKIRREAIYCHFPRGSAMRPGFQPSTYVRKGDWKLIRMYCDNEDQTDRFELYNLKNDIGETNNLAEKYPKKTKKLNQLMDTFLQETQAVIPVPNPDYNPDARVKNIDKTED